MMEVLAQYHQGVVLVAQFSDAFCRVQLIWLPLKYSMTNHTFELSSSNTILRQDYMNGWFS